MPAPPGTAIDTSNNTVGITADLRRRKGYDLTGLWKAPSDILRFDGSSKKTAGAKSLATWRASAQQSFQWTAPRLDVRSSPGRGLGLFAAEDISAFSRILDDYVLLSMAQGEDLPELWSKYLALNPEQRAAFDDLAAPESQLRREDKIASQLQQRGYGQLSALKMARVSSRYLGNSFGNEAAWWRSALYPTVARINHSCTPNAHGHSREVTGAQYVYALRDIKAGEEIEIAYFDMGMPKEARQMRARAWSFMCKCPACSGKLGANYESNVMFVYSWVAGASGIFGYADHARPERSRTQFAIDIAESDEYPWLRVMLPVLYHRHSAALKADSAGDALEREQASKRALETAIMWQARTLGEDHPEVVAMRAYQNRPAGEEAHP